MNGKSTVQNCFYHGDPGGHVDGVDVVAVDEWVVAGDGGRVLALDQPLDALGGEVVKVLYRLEGHAGQGLKKTEGVKRRVNYS